MINLNVNLFVKSWGNASASIVQLWWRKHGTAILQFGLALMAVLAVLKLSDEFVRFMWDMGKLPAVDLKFRYKEVHSWFAGITVYNETNMAVYPPASYVMLWPLLGWIKGIALARLLWAAITLVSILSLVYLVVKESGADSSLERVFVALFPLSMNSTSVALGNGQPTPLLIAALLAGLLILQSRNTSWLNDIIATLLILVALIKPSISAPFFWIVLFTPGRLRPAILIVSGYIALTLFAASFQKPDLLSLVHHWLQNASQSVGRGYANLHIWLVGAGLQKWILLASLLVLIILGSWIYHYRSSNIWILIGVTAVASRLWVKHWSQDDLLILLPMITLFRIAKSNQQANQNNVIAGTLLAVTILAMLVPHSLQNFPLPWNLLFTIGNPIVWILILGFLIYYAGQQRNKKIAQ
ncbi:MAG TPA: glycosyltransferase 87 family protein [Thermodesulfobacteriota bacterium]